MYPLFLSSTVTQFLWHILIAFYLFHLKYFCFVDILHDIYFLKKLIFFGNLLSFSSEMFIWNASFIVEFLSGVYLSVSICGSYSFIKGPLAADLLNYVKATQLNSTHSTQFIASAALVNTITIVSTFLMLKCSL